MALGRSTMGLERSLWWVLATWFLAALVAGLIGVLARAPLPPPAFAFGLTGVCLLCVLSWPAFRMRVLSIGLASLIGFHVIRFVAGLNFLWLAQRGELAPEFALPAGWGDMVIGLSAPILLYACLPARTPRRRAALLVWNLLGLLDISMVLGNGLRIFSESPAGFAPFTRLPLSMLPTFVVPLVLVTHLLIFVKLRRLARRRY